MTPPRRGGCGTPSLVPDEAFRILFRVFAEFRRRRPEVAIDVHDTARDRAVDALLARPALVRLPSGRVSAGRVRGLARRQFVWVLKEWQRNRLTPDGEIRSGPRTACSLDAAIATRDGDGRHVSDLVGSDITDPARIIDGRETLGEIASEADRLGSTAQQILSGYMRGDSVGDLAYATGLRENAIEARKSRLVKRVRRVRERHCS